MLASTYGYHDVAAEAAIEGDMSLTASEQKRRVAALADTQDVCYAQVRLSPSKCSPIEHPAHTSQRINGW